MRIANSFLKNLSLRQFENILTSRRHQRLDNERYKWSYLQGLMKTPVSVLLKAEVNNLFFSNVALRDRILRSSPLQMRFTNQKLPDLQEKVAIRN